MQVLERAAARRYAEAFVNALESAPPAQGGRTPAERIRIGLEEIRAAAQVYEASLDLRRFLGSPEIGPDEKERLMERLFGGSSGKPAMGLLHLLLRRDRMRELPAVAEQAAAVAEQRQGVVRGQAVTAHPISSAELERIARAVGRRLGRQVQLERAVDPQLLGGVRVTVGTALVDGSVREQLEQVREQLKGVKVTSP